MGRSLCPRRSPQGPTGRRVGLTTEDADAARVPEVLVDGLAASVVRCSRAI